MNHKEIPLMFQAKIAISCQLQRNQADETHPAYQWKNEWTQLYPKSPFQPLQPPPSTKPNPFARPPKPATLPATRLHSLFAISRPRQPLYSHLVIRGNQNYGNLDSHHWR